MLPWLERPIEVATLFNPAFCAVLLYDAVKSYENVQSQGMAYPLIFLILPLVLHEETRDALPSPRTKKVNLHQWIKENKLLHQGFIKRTRYLVPYTKEGLIFSIKHGFIKILKEQEQAGYLLPIDKSFVQKPSWDKKSEPALCREKAQFFGKWFADTGNAARVFEIFGIKP